MAPEFKLPRLYAIVDTSLLAGISPIDFASELVAGGVTLLQYRNKSGSAREIVTQAQKLKARLGASVRLVMNDWADLCVAAGFHGVHLGQDDLSCDAARKVIGAEKFIGLSTHNPDQISAADRTWADYIAIGPVFATSSKANPDPVIGLAGVRGARGLTRKPLVAIGGITLENCCSVIEAGADSVAVISALLRDPGKSAQDFLRVMR
jgi:thiamine-phosphate pyrophosphorylase